MNLIVEALEAARADLKAVGGRETLEKIDRAVAIINDGQAVTTADVERWATTADIYELGQAAYAIKKAVRRMGERLDVAEPTTIRAANDAVPLADLPSAIAFANSASVDDLQQLALAIKSRVAGVADELDCAQFQ